MKTTIDMYSMYLPELEHRIGKVNAKARKMGLDDCVSMSVVDTYTNDLGALVSTVEITSVLPHYDGWSVLAVIDFIEGEYLVRRVPGSDAVDITISNIVSTTCEHCNVKHERKQSLIVIRDSGEQKLVGKSCAHYYLGKSGLSLLDMAWLADDMISELRISEDRLPIITHVDLRLYLHCVNQTIRDHGWLAKSKAQLGQVPTAEIALKLLREVIARETRLEHRDNKLIDDVIAWCSDQSGNDYLHNISRLAQLQIVPVRYLGYAASMINAYQRHLQAQQQQDSENIVSIPEGRKEITGIVESIESVYTDFGAAQKMTLLIDNTWRLYCTLPKTLRNATVGDTVQLTVTVSCHRHKPGWAWGKRPTKGKIIAKESSHVA